MSVLDHWHPVALSRDLADKPLGVRLHGRQLVLFRPQSGGVAALTDVCPHRRMRLSVGKVKGDCLECCYHGWTFAANGAGESPGTPKLRTRAESYEARETHGVVWVRNRGSGAVFPEFAGEGQGYRLMVLLEHDVSAPLELVLDNFNELEHTPTTHGMFGYPLDRMHEVEAEFAPGDDEVWITYRGPSKTYPWLFRTFMRLGRHPIFHVRGVTRYSPVHTFGDYHWTDARSGKKSWVGVRNAHFLTPLDEGTTRIFTFSFMRLSNPRLYPLLNMVRPFMVRSINQEVNEDKRVLDGLADKTPTLEGLKLSRFDRVLGLNRERIERVYRSRELVIRRAATSAGEAASGFHPQVECGGCAPSGAPSAEPLESR
jgi:phenylpropionate dioxygenase-like ring-hydroxylating dioxygenase large terminal subunit